MRDCSIGNTSREMPYHPCLKAKLQVHFQGSDLLLLDGDTKNKNYLCNNNKETILFELSFDFATVIHLFISLVSGSMLCLYGMMDNDRMI